MAMLVAGEGEKISSKQNHMYQADNSIIKSQLLIFLFLRVCVHNLSPNAKDCYFIVIRLVYNITKKTNPKPTKFFPAKFNDPQVYI